MQIRLNKNYCKKTFIFFTIIIFLSLFYFSSFAEQITIELPDGKCPVAVENFVEKENLIYFDLIKTLNALGIKCKYSQVTERFIVSRDKKQIVLFKDASHFIRSNQEIVELPDSPVDIDNSLFLDINGLCILLKEFFVLDAKWDKKNKKITFQDKKETIRKKNYIKKEINTIVIDAGHGGKDNGARGKSKKTVEKHFTLAVALELVTLLKDDGMKVILTRDKDEFIGLEERANTANKSDCDLFVSIHANAHPKSSQSGTEVYIYDINATNEEAKEVAKRENIVNEGDYLNGILHNLQKQSCDELSIVAAGYLFDNIVNGLGLKARHNKKIMRAPFRVLAHTNMPAVLLEIAFITNAKEEKLLKDDNFRKKTAKMILKGIKAYKSYIESSSNDPSSAEK